MNAERTAKRIANALIRNANLYCDGETTHREFQDEQRRLWDSANRAGRAIDDAVRTIIGNHAGSNA